MSSARHRQFAGGARVHVAHAAIEITYRRSNEMDVDSLNRAAFNPRTTAPNNMHAQLLIDTEQHECCSSRYVPNEVAC